MTIERDVLSNIENGKRSIKAEELSRIAKSLGVSADQLLGDRPLDEIVLESPAAEGVSQEVRISVPAKNVKKFKEVLLYILNRVGARPNIGETVLYKLLYFIDFDFYEKYEEQLIGATYQKNTFGPTPKEFGKIVDQMIQDGEVESMKSRYFRMGQKKYLPLRSPKLEIFTAREIKLIDEVIERLGDKNAKQISDYSHGDIPWLSTEDNAVIDYESVFYRTPQYSVRDYGDDVCED